ncbi:hypothetical protein RRG08_016004 [Elysia crispata]|uniref:Uncharacterized protein n=1 Tax=Elysia crispata TaxID=231223 RepID=A0AAE1D685_9GAST|nr:hypothetical protein RRG08_016004 [Elysia crispata]
MTSTGSGIGEGIYGLCETGGKVEIFIVTDHCHIVAAIGSGIGEGMYGLCCSDQQADGCLKMIQLFRNSKNRDKQDDVDANKQRNSLLYVLRVGETVPPDVLCGVWRVVLLTDHRSEPESQVNTFRVLCNNQLNIGM